MNEKLTSANESRYACIFMTGKDWLLLALSMIPAAIFAFGDMIHSDAWIRVYTSLFHLAILLLACFASGKRKPGKATVFLLVCNTALIALGFIHHDLFLCCANCFIIPMLTALAMMSACGISHRSPFSAAGIWEVFARSVRGLFAYIPLPFVRLLSIDSKRTKNCSLAILSLCFCLPVLIVVMALLSSADTVFLHWCGTLIESIESVLSSPSAFRIPLMLISALIIFSWMFTLRMPSQKIEIGAPPSIPIVFPAMLLPMLNGVYALFVYIQFSNLFGGAATAAMTGGYAEYARTGFFQLVAVALINLCVLAVSMKSTRNGWILSMSGLLIAFTGVILSSALWRMQLYIAEYGLSVLRVLTLWSMLAIAVLLVVSIITLLKKDFPTFTIGFICIIILWVGLNAIDIDRIIAEHNVFHYLSGELAEIDREYLSSLSPSAQRVLDKLNP